MSSLFGSPNYGVASQHIAALMKEREDYEQAIRTQALRIQTLESDLAASNEQVEVQSLIAESRARQLEEARQHEEVLDLKITKMRSALRLLWGLMQEMQMRVSEQQASVTAGNVREGPGLQERPDGLSRQHPFIAGLAEKAVASPPSLFSVIKRPQSGRFEANKYQNF